MTEPTVTVPVTVEQPEQLTIEQITAGMSPDENGLPPLTDVRMSVTLANGVDLWEHNMSTVPDTETRIIDTAQRFITVLRAAQNRPPAFLALHEQADPHPEPVTEQAE